MTWQTRPHWKLWLSIYEEDIDTAIAIIHYALTHDTTITETLRHFIKPHAQRYLQKTLDGDPKDDPLYRLIRNHLLHNTNTYIGRSTLHVLRQLAAHQNIPIPRYDGKDD